ncbi:MAG: hypothetical protein LAQ69_40490 [Acidobacteriia bacterium]|nr:hypothetical protein [Terriglobia bacterium]
MAITLPSEIVAEIDRLYPWAVNGPSSDTLVVGEIDCANLGAIVELVDRVPEHLLNMSGPELFRYIRSLAAIRDAVHSFRNMSPQGRLQIGSTLKAFNGDSPVFTLRHSLAKCPDSVPSPTTSELPFFSDPALREALRNDLSDIERSLIDREWKAATVLGGAALEAILFWSLKGMPAEIAALQTKPTGPIDGWKLEKFIDVAQGLGLVDPQTRKLADLARDARNLIHPAKVLRSRRDCDKASSLTVAGAIEAVVRDVAAFCRKHNRSL